MSSNHVTASPAADHELPTGTRVTSSGPLGPWRLSASVLAAAVTSGPQLVTATSTGHDLDQALGRTLAVATVTWVLLGVINRILARTTVMGDDDRSDADDGQLASTP